MLVGGSADHPPMLLTFDAWPPRYRTLDLAGARREDCPCCARRTFEFLDSPSPAAPLALCGQDAVQIRPSGALDLDTAARRLAPHGDVQRTPWLLRCQLRDPAGITLTLFADGRLIIKGTTDLTAARSLAARFVGC